VSFINLNNTPNLASSIRQAQLRLIVIILDRQHQLTVVNDRPMHIQISLSTLFALKARL